MSESENRTLTIKKTFKAPIDLVWEAWTNPEHIAKWWGPKGMTTRIVKHDLVEGGDWEFAMTMPDGNDFIGEGKYLEIEKPTRLVCSANFRPMTEDVQLEILLKSNGDKTDFTFNVLHKTVEYKQAQEKMGFQNGWGSTFERLKELVES